MREKHQYIARLVRSGDGGLRVSALRQQENRQTLPGEVFDVVCQQREFVIEGYGRYGYVAEIQCYAFARIVAFQQTCQAGGGAGDRIVLQAGEKFRGGIFFTCPQPCINLGDIDGTAGQQMTRIQQIQQQAGSIAFVIESIDCCSVPR